MNLTVPKTLRYVAVASHSGSCRPVSSNDGRMDRHDVPTRTRSSSPARGQQYSAGVLGTPPRPSVTDSPPDVYAPLPGRATGHLDDTWSRRVVAVNVSQHASALQLRQFFPYMLVKAPSVQYDANGVSTGVVAVEFCEPSDAQAAIQQSDNTYLAGRRVRVLQADPVEHHQLFLRPSQRKDQKRRVEAAEFNAAEERRKRQLVEQQLASEQDHLAAECDRLKNENVSLRTTLRQLLAAMEATMSHVAEHRGLLQETSPHSPISAHLTSHPHTCL